MRTIRLTKENGIEINNGVHRVQPPRKVVNDFGVPKMRPCAFPTSMNPFEKRGKHLGNIHKMYKFKSMTGGK